MRANAYLGRSLASFLLLCAFGVLAVGSGDSDKDTQKVKSAATSYTLTADELVAEYAKNEVAADSKFKGQIVVVSGTVQSIGKDITDDAYVVVGGKGFLDGVQCTFTKGEIQTVGALSKGQQISLKGEVSGKMGNIMLKTCTIQ